MFVIVFFTIQNDSLAPDGAEQRYFLQFYCFVITALQELIRFPPAYNAPLA